jgi:hypothetical protein
MSIQDPDNPDRYLAVRGRVISSDEEGAREHIEKQAQRYTGASYRGPVAGRRLHKIAPETVLNPGMRR